MKKISSNNTKKKKKIDFTGENMFSFPQAHIICTKYKIKIKQNIKNEEQKHYFCKKI